MISSFVSSFSSADVLLIDLIKNYAVIVFISVSPSINTVFYHISMNLKVDRKCMYKSLCALFSQLSSWCLEMW